MRKCIVCVAIALCFSSCSKNEPGADESGQLEGTEITLDLTVDNMQSPVARNRNSRVVAHERIGGMLVELIESPQTEPTPATKVLPDGAEKALNNLWFFVYETSAVDAKLIHKKYYASIPNKGIKLVMQADQRVVLVANTFDPDFGRDDLTLGTTYQALLDKTTDVVSENSILPNNGQSMVFSGTAVYDGVVTSLPVNMSRNLVRVDVGVRLSTDANMANYKAWKIQMCDLPDKSYYLPRNDGDASVTFPATVGTPISYAEKTITPNTTQFTSDTWYIPVNRRGKKPGTMPFDRKTNAPAGATYIKITGQDIYSSITYTLHLGEDFYEDYNLRPNYQYSYQLTLYGEEGLDFDSRVDVKEMGIDVGRFGGTITGDITKGWGFTNKLYLDEISILSPWADNNNSLLANTTIDNGKANTWLLKDASYYPVSHCFNINVNSETITEESDKLFAWYLPAIEEQRRIWLTQKSNTAFPLIYLHWSSSYYNNTAVRHMNFDDGYLSRSSDLTGKLRVRCVRRSEAQLNLNPQVYKDASGRVILDCTVPTGMPAGAITRISKCVEPTGYNDKYRDGSTGVNSPYAFEDDQLYEKLEIAPMNMNSMGQLATTGKFDMSWADAYTNCKALNYKGVTGWRLPTKRELLLIYIFRIQINEISQSVGGSTFTGYAYWSSLESGSVYSSYVNFNDGDTGTNHKFALPSFARCVREL